VIPLATHAWGETLPGVAGFLGQGAGWRIAFLLTGAAGLVWLVPWLWMYRSPKDSKLITGGELQMLEAASAAESPAGSSAKPWTWMQVFTFRGTWLLLVGRLITDPVWYFYQFWFPKYLSADRHLSQDQLKITWIVYAAAGVGSLLGGWLSGQLIKRGTAPAASRLWIMLGCACLMPLSPLIARATGLNLALALTVGTVIAALAWLINLSSIVVDIVPKHSLGTVFSVVATGSTIGGIIMNLIVATMVSGPSTKPAGFLDQAIKSIAGGLLELVQGHGYAQWFWIMAILHPIAWLLLYFGGVHKKGVRD
jgi:ACS family hexuronate transporter-like MFS transporter